MFIKKPEIYEISNGRNDTTRASASFESEYWGESNCPWRIYSAGVGFVLRVVTCRDKTRIIVEIISLERDENRESRFG